MYDNQFFICFSSQIDPGMDENMDFGFNATDYNPEDIDQINVNELINLHQQPKPPNWAPSA